MERRKFPRYDISHVSDLVGNTKVEIIQKTTIRFDLALISMSIGGCGFYGPNHQDCPLKLGDRLTLEFAFKDKRCAPVEVRGDIVSITPRVHQGRLDRFYAIRFIESQRKSMNEILHEIDHLVQLGKAEAV